jgi:DNA-binding transcriptional LysR family regulator
MAIAGARGPERRASRYFRMRDLELLNALAHSSSMAKAAQMLSISQPAVSKAIADLEGSLGVKLLDRGFAGARLTVYGEVLSRSAHLTLNELRQCLRDIDALADPEAGEVRIGAPEPVTAGLVSAAVVNFTRRYPRAFVEIVNAHTSQGTFSELRERKADLLVGRIPRDVAADDLAIEMLFTEHRFVVCGARSRWARLRKIGLAELRDGPWVVATPGEAQTELRQAFESYGLEPPRARVVSNSLQLRRSLLASGDYLTLLTMPSINAFESDHFVLKRLPIELPMLDSPFAIVTLRHRTLSPVVGRFIECLRPVAASLERKFR